MSNEQWIINVASGGVGTSDASSSIAIGLSELTDTPSSIDTLVHSDLPCSLSVPPKNTLYGVENIIPFVLVSNVDSDIQSSIDTVIYNSIPCTVSVPPHNTLYGRFSVKPMPVDTCTSFPSSIDVKQVTQLPCSISVSPHNILWGYEDIQPPPIITDSRSDIIDAFVRSMAPRLNYGSEWQMLVGSNGTDVYRSLLKFDVSDMRKDVVYTSAKIVLTQPHAKDTATSIDLYSVEQPWSEYGITWAGSLVKDPYDETNAPATYTKVSTFSTSTDSTEVEVDVMPLFNQWLTGANDGIQLRASDETLNNYIQLFTREIGISGAPQLVTTYYDPIVRSNGRNQRPCSITVRHNELSDIQSDLTINSYNHAELIPSSIRVKEPNTILGSIDVGLANWIHGHADVDSSIDVCQRDVSDLPSSIGCSTPFIVSSVTVLSHADTQCSISVRQWTQDDILSSVTVSRPNMDGHVYVPQREDTLSSIDLRRWKDEDFTSALDVSNPSIACSLSIRRWEGEDLPSSIAVQQSANSDIYCTVTTSKPDMPSSINVIAGTNIECSIDCSRNESVYIDSSITLQQNVIVDIPSSITLNLHSDLPCSIHCNSGNLLSSIGIPHHVYLDLPCEGIIRAKEASDIPSSIRIGSAGAYVFIM